MADQLIVPDQLPHRVPGQLTVHTPAEGRDGPSVRGYCCAGSDVEVLPMRDYMIVAYRRGTTFMRRWVDSEWIHEELGPGDVSLREGIALDDLAATVALSRYHFARRFRESVGTAPHEFVVQQGIEQAKTLLRRTERSLTDIACGCGFADQSHMTREFKKRVGATLARYRSEDRRKSGHRANVCRLQESAIT
jgi:AraC-like DNA-binding protein